MERKSAVLLPISATTGETGIGDFGRGSREYIDYIKSMGFSVWQILPILVVGMGYSPYSGDSAYAGNHMLIDITALPKHLISAAELEEARYKGSPYSVDYDYARVTKREVLRLAYSRLTAADEVLLDAFIAENSHWLQDYATYMAIKEDTAFAPWRTWSDPLKCHKPKALEAFRKAHSATYGYYCYEQYIFFTQWAELKAYANTKGVEIFGDIPIYVAEESVDVWAHSDLFQLDERLNPTRVSGVPPDYFSEDGQLWRNPLYDYDKMAEDDYKWWIDRILNNLKLYDILRIDHFRAFSEYWSIDAKEKTAKNGKWVTAPRMEIFNALFKVCKNPCIVAEDLGIINDKVVSLLEETGFPGMRVLHFGFDGDVANTHLPHNYCNNCVAYTATHDNNTTLGWLYELDENIRKNVLEYINVHTPNWNSGAGKCVGTRSAIRTILSSVANLAVIPMQDLCGYGGDTRTNIPGVADGNWCYRITPQAMAEVDKEYILHLNTTYNRK
ncbi:MAG: 4-alpha-glucanotransferase [Bacillota bacterium]